MSKENTPSIAFWKKDTGNIMSHGSGLSVEQVAFLQSLKVGQRLILWSNNGAEGSKPTHNLKVFKTKEELEQVPSGQDY